RFSQGQALVPDVRVSLMQVRPYDETGIFHDNGDLGTFEELQKKKMTARVKVEEKVEEGLYRSLVRASATADGWQQIVSDAGDSLSDLAVVKHAMSKISEKLSSGGDVDRTNVGLCLFGDETGLEIPFEWSARRGTSVPICMEHPVRRFLIGVESRTTLRK